MNDKGNNWFKLYASCILVNGAASNLLYDVERQALYELTKDVMDILSKTFTNDVSAICESYNNQIFITDLFNQLIKEELGFYTTDPDSFPPLELKWNSPYHITNSIIELDFTSDYNFASCISQLNSLGCRAVQIRLLSPFNSEYIEDLLGAFNDSRINHIELYISYESDIDSYAILKYQTRLNRIIVYGSPYENVAFSQKVSSLDKAVLYVENDIRDTKKEIIKHERFVPNIETFTESQEHNLGLNRKICIDRKGNLKNYLSHDSCYGNVFQDRIKNVVDNPKFHEKWFISNDMIEVCKDCQYRYVCINNSDIQKTDKKYRKISMCDFDPYLNEWKMVTDNELNDQKNKT